MADKAQKVGEVVGGKSGQVYDVYYHDMTGMYRISRQGETNSDIGSGVVGSPDEALKAAREHVKTK
jgi:hypothetical protein